MSAQVSPADLDWIVEFVNEYSDGTRLARGDESAPYRSVDELGESPPQALGMSERQLIDLANRLFEIFDVGLQRDQVEMIDALLSEARPVPHVGLQEGRLLVTWDAGPATTSVTAASALAFVDLLAGQNRKRPPLGTCHAEACADVFVDRSRGKIRMYCSLNCQNRTKVAAFRARQREEARTAR